MSWLSSEELLHLLVTPLAANPPGRAGNTPGGFCGPLPLRWPRRVVSGLVVWLPHHRFLLGCSLPRGSQPWHRSPGLSGQAGSASQSPAWVRFVRHGSRRYCWSIISFLWYMPNFYASNIARMAIKLAVCCKPIPPLLVWLSAFLCFCS